MLFFENFFCVLIVKRLNGYAVSRFLGLAYAELKVNLVEGYAVLASLFQCLRRF